MNIKIDWMQCRHGHELRFGRCPDCQREQDIFLQQAFAERDKPPARIPIKRGCQANGPCFCTGACQEIVGYRERIFPGEKP